MESFLGENPRIDQKLFEISAEMDKFEGYAGEHGARVAKIADELGAAFNLSSRDRFFLEQAALIHDIGEMFMKRDYIKTNRVLNIEERLDLQRHPVIGERETAKLGLPRGVQLIVRWHHEWWCGSGYPDGLEAEQIPLAARILRVADTYASLTGDRPFRAAMRIENARKFMTEWAGIEFDPEVVRTFLAITPVRETEMAVETYSSV